MERASFISSFSFSTVMPFLHLDSGLRFTIVSNISRGAGSVGVSARPAFPKTWLTSGIFFQNLVLELEEVCGYCDGRGGGCYRHVE